METPSHKRRRGRDIQHPVNCTGSAQEEPKRGVDTPHMKKGVRHTPTIFSQPHRVSTGRDRGETHTTHEEGSETYTDNILSTTQGQHRKRQQGDTPHMKRGVRH